MERRTIEQIHLCLNELSMVKQLIDLKISDDFSTRLLAIYATMRVDDITKIWSHQIPKDSMERYLSNDVKKQYNQGLRLVRDKLGGHYQKIGDSNNVFDTVKLFKSIIYANIACLIENIFYVESKIEKKLIKPKGFEKIEDLNIAKKVLLSLNSDDQARITNGTLDIFGINKGFLISSTKEQKKAQDLKSIEEMVSIVYTLLNQDYISIEVEHMFKRLYVSIVYNYHDNLITRRNVSNVQFEEGFDILFKNLISEKDDKDMLEKAFDDFENIYKVSEIINKYRDIRNKACAHLDENSTIEEINTKLNSLNTKELHDAYNKMLSIFNFICNNVLCLTMMRLPTRSPIYGGQIEPLINNENFYGEVSKVEIQPKMSCTEIMRYIKKNSDRYGEAKDTLLKKLMSRKNDVYEEMISALISRLREPSISNEEMTTIIQSLYDAKGYFPERMQRTILYMLQDEAIFKNCNVHLLWILSFICREDSKINIQALLDDIMKQNNIICTTLSLLAFLHMTVEKAHSYKNKAHDISETFINYCASIKNKTEKCAMILALSQHWFHGSEYKQYRGYETIYSDFFLNETETALREYYLFAKMDKDYYEQCKKCLNTKHYLLLLSRLTYWETIRNQKNNVFMDLWKHNCFIRIKCDLYEALSVGCLTEQEGNIEYAKNIFDTLVKENPINKDAIQERENFYNRNPDIRR